MHELSQYNSYYSITDTFSCVIYVSVYEFEPDNKQMWRFCDLLSDEIILPVWVSCGMLHDMKYTLNTVCIFTAAAMFWLKTLLARTSLLAICTQSACWRKLITCRAGANVSYLGHGKCASLRSPLSTPKHRQLQHIPEILDTLPLWWLHFAAYPCFLVFLILFHLIIIAVAPIVKELHQ